MSIMQNWDGKSKGNAIGYKIFVWILKEIGISPAYFVLRFVTLYYFLFSYKSSKAIYYYFHNRLGYGFIMSLYKLYTTYFLFGQSIIDKIVIMSGMPNKFTIDFDGEENLRKIVEQKKGGLLLSAHLGNWEIAGHLLKRLNAKVNIVMFDGEEENIKNFLESLVGESAVNIIVIKNDLSHIYEISQSFQNNEIVCMHADRFVEDNKTYTIDFLGEEARFPSGPFILATKFKVPVSFVFSLKESRFHYHFYATSIIDYAKFDKKNIANEILKNYILELENKIDKYSEQWYNFYYFWKK